MNKIGNDDIEERQLCVACVDDSYLKSRIREKGCSDYCSYCDNESRCLPLGEIASMVDRAFSDHYQRTAIEPDGWEYAMMKEYDQDWDRAGEQVVYVIEDVAGVDEKIAADLLSVLEDKHADQEAYEMGEECDFSSESHYELKHSGAGKFDSQWREFVEELTTRARFFSSRAKSILEDIFGEIESMESHTGSGTIVKAGPKTSIDHLFRARVFRNEQQDVENALCYPWDQLGPPPSAVAAAGRMNPSGISVFYGAKEPGTAIAEVRPPVGSWIVVAKFDILHPLRLLDLNALRSIVSQGSLLDPATLLAKQKVCFLDTLISKIAGPVLPHEEEFKYLPTQAVSEFLSAELKLDGIVFPSVQAGGGATNVVLFHHAAKVLKIQLPTEAKLSASMNLCHPDEEPDGFTVWEEMDESNAASKNPEVSLIENLFPTEEGSGSVGSGTLAVDLKNLTVHYVDSVKFKTNSFDVSRYRHSPKKENF